MNKEERILALENLFIEHYKAYVYFDKEAKDMALSREERVHNGNISATINNECINPLLQILDFYKVDVNELIKNAGIV